jgi:hypothetical protein
MILKDRTITRDISSFVDCTQHLSFWFVPYAMPESKLSFFSKTAHCKNLVHNVKYIKIHDFDLCNFAIQWKTTSKNFQCDIYSVIKLPIDVVMWKMHVRRTMCM